MNETITVATDGSPAAEAAIRWAAKEAVRSGDRLLIAHAIETPIPAYTSYGVGAGAYRLDVPALQRAARQLLDSTVNVVRDAHPTLDVDGALERGETGRVLVELAKDSRLLVVGTHEHHGPITDVILGSNARFVLHHATTTVAVIPPPTEPDLDRNPTRIAVGVDGSPPAARALEWAAVEAFTWGAQLDVIHCWDYPYVPLGASSSETQERIRLDAVHELDTLVDALRSSRPDLDAVRIERHVVNGSPSGVLLDAAARSDMLVVGTRGRGGFRTLLVGSAAQHVAQHSTSPVVVVRN
jgi:nucleotide-binding universal stress UspA family protein